MSIVKQVTSTVAKTGLPVRLCIKALLACALLSVTGCSSLGSRSHVRLPKRAPDIEVTTKVTGYSDDKISTGWKRNWLGRPVYAYGKNKGKPKKVGITSTGTKARYGTMASDHRYLPVGSVIYVPGYGVGQIEDTGGALKGYHVDLFFKTRQQALNWGNQRRRIQVWLPR